MLDITEQRLKALAAQGFKPRTIFDIGAFVGDWSKMAKNIWPTANIVLFEANSDCYETLKTRELGQIENVLLGRNNKNKVKYFSSINEYKTGNSIFLEQTSYFKKSEIRLLKMQKLDSIVKDKKYKNIDFIKIDTQGSELEIIAGGINTIKNAEFVLLETQNLTYNLGAPKTLDVIKRMNNLGFMLFDITQIHHLPTGEMQGVDMMFARNNSKYIKKGLLW